MSGPIKALMVFLLLIQALCVASCGSIAKRPIHPLFDLNSYEISSEERDEINRLIGFLNQKNVALTTYKGIGNIKLWGNKRVISSRAAWTGDTPMKLRLEMLGIHGGPIASVAINGPHFYYYSHVDKQYYARPLTEEGLKPFLSFSLPVDVVTYLLMGRIPVYDYRFAKITANPAGEGFVLTLVAKDGEKAEKIFLNRKKNSITMIEYYDKKGSLEVRAALSNQRRVASFEIPFTIAISDAKGNGLELDIDRYWTDVSVDASVFILSRNPG
jgi:hypothetical protein